MQYPPGPGDIQELDISPIRQRTDDISATQTKKQKVAKTVTRYEETDVR